MINTIKVVIIVSRRLGHVTFWVSVRTSCRNLNGLTFAILATYGDLVCPQIGTRSPTANNGTEWRFLFGSTFAAEVRLRAARDGALTTARRRNRQGNRVSLAVGWQEWRDSNPQPPVLETGALTN